MSSTLTYNFPSSSNVNNPVTLCNGTSSITIPPSPLPNFSDNKWNYISKSIFICKEGDARYFVIKSATDDDIQTLYVAIPLVSSDTNKSSDIQKLIEARDKRSTSASIDLNNVFKTLLSISDGTKGKMWHDKQLPNHFFVANKSLGVDLGKEEIQGNPQGVLFSSISTQPGNMDCGLVQQGLGWDLDCTLLDENGNPFENPTTNTSVATSDSANTLVLMTLVLLFACCTYIGSPVIYPYIYTAAQKTDVHIKDSSINLFWLIALILGAIPSIITGATQANSLYFLITISFGITYFSGTASVLKSLGSNDSRVTDGAFSNEPDLINHVILLFSGFTDKLSYIGYIFAAIIVLSWVTAITGAGLGSRPEGHVTFIVGIVVYVAAIIGKFALLYKLG